MLKKSHLFIFITNIMKYVWLLHQHVNRNKASSVLPLVHDKWKELNKPGSRMASTAHIYFPSPLITWSERRHHILSGGRGQSARSLPPFCVGTWLSSVSTWLICLPALNGDTSGQDRIFHSVCFYETVNCQKEIWKNKWRGFADYCPFWISFSLPLLLPTDPSPPYHPMCEAHLVQ